MTNETPVVSDMMEFKKLDGLKPQEFTNIYGDCFVSGFLEGGEFSAIISIKVHDKANVSKVKLAAEAQLAVGASPLSVGGAANVDKDKESAWKDTETTISVNWSGGGDIKTPDTNWDLATVVKAANEFPRKVADVSSRTSAILTKYTALRTFQEENAKIGYKYVILDYDLCGKAYCCYIYTITCDANNSIALYTTDLFSGYMAYKHIWKQLSDMLKQPRAYKALEKCKEVLNPIQTDPVSLDLARLEVRKALVEITNEVRPL